MTCSNCAAYISALSIAVVFYIGAQHLNSSLVQKNSVQNLRDLLLYQLTVLKRYAWETTTIAGRTKRPCKV